MSKFPLVTTSSLKNKILFELNIQQMSKTRDIILINDL